MPDDLERLIRNLIRRAVEDLTLEYKGKMAWTGNRPQKMEIIKDVVCLANARGGHILVGVEEVGGGFRPVGLSDQEQASFDQTSMASLGRSHFAPAPTFTVRKAEVDGVKHVLVEVSEFADVPIVCTKDSGGTIRQGAIYMRTDDPACEQIRSSDQMRTLIDSAVTKRSDALLQQIAELMSQMGFVIGEGRSPTADHEPGFDQAIEFLEQAGPTAPYWQLTLQPVGEPVSLGRPELRRAVSRSKVEMRGWDFPHVDDRFITAFEDGEESVFSWNWYEEAFRALRNGLFAWRGRTTEEFTEDGKVNLVSAIFSLTQFVAFAAEYANHAYSQGGVVLEVQAVGMRDRVLSARPGRQLHDEYRATVDRFQTTTELSYIELRVSYAEVAGRLAREFFELFNWYDSAGAIDHWQRQLVHREL